MKLLLFTALLLSVEAADNCGDRCTSTQVCGNNGTCLDKSDLVKCGAWPLSYYCPKRHNCCGYQGCMPAGAECCGLVFYCDIGHTCCGTSYCCEAGTFCDNGKCFLDKYSTKKPLTTRSVETRTPPTTRKVRTTFFTESRTRYPTTKTTKWFNDYTTRNSYRRSSSNLFRWWYGVIIGAAVVTVAIIIAAVIWNRRNSRSNAPGQSGTGGMVLSAPPQIYGAGAGGMVLRAPVQTNGLSPRQNIHTTAPNTGVPIHTNGHQPTQNVAFMVTKTGVPVQTNGKPTNQKN